MTIEQVAGRFVLDPEPARRGMSGHVHRARDYQNANAQVAVKLYDGDDVDDEVLHECFLREREALRVLNHPNIVRLIDAGYDSERSQHYVALEWLEKDLLAWLGEQDPSSWFWTNVSRKVLVPLLRALSAAHARHIWHRDIKPANLMVGPEGEVRLTDFGIAKLVDSVRFGMTLRDFRTKPYAPPEHDSDQFDDRSDLYSLGVTALRMRLSEISWNFERRSSRLVRSRCERDRR